MFKPFIFLLMVICCNLMVAEIAQAQMSPAQAKKMREAIARSRKEAMNKKDMKEESSEKRSTAASNRGRPSAAKANSEAKKEMKMADTANTSFKLFDVKPKSLLAVLDSDGDGQLSGKEIDFATDQLLRLDVNDNGQIDVDELPKGMMAGSMSKGFDPAYKGPGEQVYKTIAGFDADANGVLTRSEMRAEYRGAFRAIDADGNREIDPNELLMFAKEQ